MATSLTEAKTDRDSVGRLLAHAQARQVAQSYPDPDVPLRMDADGIVDPDHVYGLRRLDVVLRAWGWPGLEETEGAERYHGRDIHVALGAVTEEAAVSSDRRRSADERAKQLARAMEARQRGLELLA